MKLMKKCMAVYLMLILIVGGIKIPSVQAAGKDVAIRFRAINVSGAEDTLELGVFVETKNGEAFKSVSAVLEVDNDILEIIPWSSTTAYDLTAATEWSKAVAIETKRPDDLYAAGAIAYNVGESGSGDSGGGEVIENQPGKQKAEKINAKAPETEEPDGGDEPPTVTVSGNRTYINISAESMFPVEYSAEKYPEGKRLMTLRFRYATALDGTKKNKTDVLMGTTIRIAQDKQVVYESPSQHGIQYFTDQATYYYNPLTETEEGAVVEDTEVEESLLLAYEDIFDTMAVPDGDSLTYVDASNYGALIFYDWDDTLLGAVTVSKNASVAAIAGEIKTFADTKKASADKESDYGDKVNPDDGYYSSIDPETGKDKGEKYPLTYKKAYRFEDVWLYATSDAFECYKAEDIIQEPEEGGTPTTIKYYTVEPGNHGFFSDYTSDELPSNAQIADELKRTGTVLLKAAYKAEKNINTGEGGSRYTVTNIAYNRYGPAANTTGTYSIILTMKRENEDGVGVSRLHRPTLKVTLAPEAAPTATSFVSLTLENKDEASVEVAAHKLVGSVRTVLIDMEYSPIWASSAVEYTNAITFNNRENKTQGTEGFVKQGSIGFINSQGIAVNLGQDNYWSSYVNNIAFRDAGITSGGKQMTVALANAAKELLLKTLKENDNKPLTPAQMQYAVDNEGKLLQE